MYDFVCVIEDDRQCNVPATVFNCIWLLSVHCIGCASTIGFVIANELSVNISLY